MVKKYKIILTVLLVALIGTVIVLISGLDFNKIVADNEAQNNPTADATYRDVFLTRTDINVPLLKTDIDGVVYGMDTQGNVTFYEVGENSLTKIEETESYEVKVSCSDQTLTAQMHCLEKDGKLTGYGLFTNELYPDVYIYSYAFFKVTDFFPGYSHSDDTLLLMVDTDQANFYKENKVYSEIFTFSKSSHSSSYFLNEDQRTIDLNAKMRTDYKMFTDDIDEQSGSTLYFFSARFHTAYDEYTKFDIMRSGGSGENVDNIQYVKEVASLNFWETSDGIRYFRNTEDESGFVLYSYNGKEETEIKSFTGSLSDNYVINGNFILNRTEGEIYNVITGEIHYLDYSNMVKGFNPDMFAISPDGNHCIVRGPNERNNPAIIIADFLMADQSDFTDDTFGFIENIIIRNDGTAILSVATDSQGTSSYLLMTASAEQIAAAAAAPATTAAATTVAEESTAAEDTTAEETTATEE